MSTPTDERWPVLYVLAQAYFGEEWPDDYDTPAEVIDVFLARRGEFAGELATEIRDVLRTFSDAELPALFESIDLLVDPSVDLNSHRGWLEGIVRRAEPRSNRKSSTSPLAAAGQDQIARTPAYPALAALGRDHFTEGWRSRHYSSTRLVVEEFMTAEPGLAAELPDEIAQLLERLDEAELGCALRALGIDYEPTAELNTNRGWLNEVARRARMPLGLITTDPAAAHPALYALAQIYFGEDWPDFYDDDPLIAVDAFMDSHPGLSGRLPAEIDQLLMSRPSEPELADLFRRFELLYDPPEMGGQTHRDWLIAVANRARQAG